MGIFATAFGSVSFIAHYLNTYEATSIIFELLDTIFLNLT